MIRRLAPVLLVLAAAGALAINLPPRSRELGAAPASFGPVARGAFHVHTTVSDGGGTVDGVAAAAAKAGLQFVIITDHGDGTRPPDPPSYRSGVLCIDAVEISTESGHLVAIGLPQAPYRLGGEGRDVIDDIARLGGFAVAAHPAPARGSTRWTEWTAPFGGIEWLNGDTEWRDERAAQMTRAVFAYPFRASEALTSLLDRPALVMARWDALTQRRRVVGLAAADAHARLALRGDDDDTQRGFAFRLPGYAAVLKSFSIAIPGVRLRGRADADARAIIEAIRLGHVFSAIDGLAGAGALQFSASSGRNTAEEGDLLALDGPVRLRALIHGPAEAQIVLFKNGARLSDTKGTWLERTVDATRAVYRIEAHLPNAPGDPPVPWLVSNPIYVGMSDAAAAPAHPRASSSLSLEQGMTEWTIEHSAASQGAVNVISAADGGKQALFRYALSGARSSYPYVGMAISNVSGLEKFDRLTFRARADKPTRMSIQLHRRLQGSDSLWHRSVYVDTAPRDVTVFLDDVRPRPGAPAERVSLRDINAILFVVESLNTKVGTGGQITVDQVRLER